MPNKGGCLWNSEVWVNRPNPEGYIFIRIQSCTHYESFFEMCTAFVHKRNYYSICVYDEKDSVTAIYSAAGLEIGRKTMGDG